MLSSLGMLLEPGAEVKQCQHAQFACDNKKLVDKMYIIFHKLRKFCLLNTLYNNVGPV